MPEALAAILISILVMAVMVTAAVGWLLVRQLRRAAAWRRRMSAALLPNRIAVAAASQASGLGRHWAVLLRDAMTARQRFDLAVGDLADGPLRAGLQEAACELDAAVAEARRLAHQGSKADRAHRDVLAALDRQRRRQRRAGVSPEVEASLDAATRAQHASAERLSAAARRDLCRLQLVVARMHELTAHALELGTLANTAELTTAASVADRLAALRLATVEVEAAASA